MVIVHEDADDLTQDIFIKVYNHLEGFKQNSQLFTWIYRIATNECLSFLRKKRNRFFIPIHDVERELSNKLESESIVDGNDTFGESGKPAELMVKYDLSSDNIVAAYLKAIARNNK